MVVTAVVTCDQAFLGLIAGYCSWLWLSHTYFLHTRLRFLNTVPYVNFAGDCWPATFQNPRVRNMHLFKVHLKFQMCTWSLRGLKRFPRPRENQVLSSLSRNKVGSVHILSGSESQANYAYCQDIFLESPRANKFAGWKSSSLLYFKTKYQDLFSEIPLQTASYTHITTLLRLLHMMNVRFSLLNMAQLILGVTLPNF
jgi:hypothetical protein